MQGLQRTASACMKNYAGPACKTEYQMCLKSCKAKKSGTGRDVSRMPSGCDDRRWHS